MEVNGDIDVRYLVDKKGNKTDVVLTLEEYEELIEDIHDLSVALERQNDQRMSLRELEERLKEDGLILRYPQMRTRTGT
jgi:hypothetical protein